MSITNKCVIILSEKSSGSSACQNILTNFAKIKQVSKTPHFENETLYWTKAASILRLPQNNMIDSEVPIERNKARAGLIRLLKDNLEGYLPPSDDKELIFGGWKLLCEKYAPIFLEKSPHHLYQWSALELIIECINKNCDIDFLLIGLIRNPMDTIYSQFKRWKARPEKLQYQWLIAYQNLQMLKGIAREKLVIVRYEDIVSSLSYLKPVFDFCDITIDDAYSNYLHQKSVLKWRNDKFFGFVLSNEVTELAQSYGYEKDQLANRSTIMWPIYREFARASYKVIRPIKKLLRRAITRLNSIFGI
jgi:hypothetical protein